MIDPTFAFMMGLMVILLTINMIAGLRHGKMWVRNRFYERSDPQFRSILVLNFLALMGLAAFFVLLIAGIGD